MIGCGASACRRGPAPILYESAVLTTGVVGALIGIAIDEAISTFFRRYYPDYFPRLCRVDGTTFTRQAANLWGVRQQLWQHLLTHVATTPRPCSSIHYYRLILAHRVTSVASIPGWTAP